MDESAALTWRFGADGPSVEQFDPQTEGIAFNDAIGEMIT